MIFKKYIINTVICALALLTVSVESVAVPAKPGLLTVTLADGTSIKVRIVGDERSHYYLSEDGYLLTRGADDYFYYSDFDASEGVFKATAVRARDISLRDSAEKRFLQARAKGVPEEARLLPKRRGMAQRKIMDGSDQKLKDFPTLGEQKTLAILVQFKDKKFTVENPAETFHDFMMKEGFTHENGAHFSVHDYYKTCSDGKFEPKFDVYGPVTLSQNLAYYGGNDAYGSDDKPEQMVREACELLDDEINFADYDRNGDGWVDNVYIFYAGYSEAEGGSANSIWPHSWDIWLGAQVRLNLDGVYIGPYGCSQELNYSNNKLVGIGVFCHEFGHVLGLPDVYSTDYNQLAFTPGAYTLMDAGEYNDDSNTPPYLTAYERWVLGWHTPEIIDRAMNATLPPFSSGETKSYLIQTTDTAEFYFLENRQQEGYDTHIPGHGMLVWHIDYDPKTWSNNSVNNLSTHQGIDLVEADAMLDENTRDGDPFPGASNVASFTDNTYPSMRDWQGADLNLPITGIKEENGIITFKVLGGVFELDAVKLSEIQDVSATSLRIEWTSVARANNYLLNLYLLEGSEKVYVKRNFEMGNVNEYVVTGLLPQTTYYATVSASDGAHLSAESNVVSATTLEPDFSFYTPTVSEPTDITRNSFVANWEPLEGASEYFLSVFNRNNSGEQIESIDFSEGMDSFTEGWKTNCNSLIMTEGCFGNASPSLRMGMNGSYIQSPVYTGNITQFGFWYKGAYMGPDNIASVQVSTDGKTWDVVDFLNLTDGSEHYVLYGEGQEISLSPDVVQFRIYFEKSQDSENPTGFIYIDDIRVVVEGHDEPLVVEGYSDLNVGNNLSQVVTGLSAGTDYIYRIKAFDGTLYSLNSPDMSVRTLDDVSVQEASAQAFRVYCQNGSVVIQAEAGSCVDIYTTSGEWVTRIALPDGEAVTHLDAGVYLCRCGSLVRKVIVR